MQPSFESIWEAFLKRHGFTTVFLGGWSSRKALRAPGPDESAWRVLVERSDLESQPIVRFSSVIDDPVQRKLELRSTTAGRQVAVDLGFMQDLLVHDAELDARFVIQSDDVELVHDLYSCMKASLETMKGVERERRGRHRGAHPHGYAARSRTTRRRRGPAPGGRPVGGAARRSAQELE